jgi:hypothetical protein
MLDLIGALFLVGLGTAVLASITACGQIGLLQVIKYGSIWVLFPAAVFLITGEKYITTLSIWIPTFVMVNYMISACSHPPETQPSGSQPQPDEEDCVDE